MHEAMLCLPLMPSLFFDEQMAGKGIVICSFDSLPDKNTKKYSHGTSLQTERVKKEKEKNKNKNEMD